MRNLFRDTLIYGASAVLSRGLSLVVLPIYTRMLSPADYGALDMITVAGTLAALVVAMEVNQAIARLYGEAAEPSERRRMASTALWFTVAAYGAMLLAALLASGPLSELLLGAGHETAFRIGAAFIAATGIFYLVQNQLRVELRAKDYALLSLGYAVATVTLGVLLGYVLGLGLTGVLIAQLAAALLAVAAGAWRLRATFTLSFDGAILREMLRFSLPLVPSGMATFLTLYANRLLLNAMISLEAVGLFGVAARIAGIIALLTVGLQSSLTPLIYAHYKEPGTPAAIAGFFETFVAIALAGCLALGLFAPELLALLAEARYAPAGPYVMMLAPATLLSQAYIFFPGIAIARRTHLQLLIFAITGVFSLAANWLLIRSFGLPGAAAATLLSSALFLMIWIVVSERLYPLPVRWRRLALLCALFALACAAGLLIFDSGLPAMPSVALRIGLLAMLVGACFGTGVVRGSDLRRIAGRFRRRPA